MAKTPAPSADAQSTSFMREVDEAYRQDQFTTLWSRYGRVFLVLLGLILIGFAAFLWWQDREVAASAEQAEAFDQAVKGLDLGDPDAVAAIEALADSDTPGYSQISRLLEAGFMVDDGNVEGAVAAYREIEGDPSVAQPLRDLAAIRAAKLSFDDAEPGVIISSLAPLAQSESPWFGVAGELTAAAYLKQGEEQRAGELYAAIAADEDLPPSLRDRASQMAAALGGLPRPAADTEAAARGAATEAQAEAAEEAAE